MKRIYSSYNDLQLFQLFKEKDKYAFEELYERYAEAIYKYTFARINSKEISEEIVQEIFISLWTKRNELEIKNSLNSYLFGAAKYKILTYIRSKGIERKYAAHLTHFLTEQYDNPTEDLINSKELKETIESVISELPERCQLAFRLSRMEHKSIAEIAEIMEISPRTVENYITQALKHLRSSLGDFLTYLIVWMHFN